MPTTTLLLLVEGPHDLEFCARLLKPAGFSRVQSLNALRRDQPFWYPAVPRNWPHNGDDLLARHPVPTFLTNNANQSVAIVTALGIDKLARQLGLTLENLHTEPDAVGIILDADDIARPENRFRELLDTIGKRPESSAIKLKWPSVPGAVGSGPPKSGVFVMPDNRSEETLEDLILDAAESTYPELHCAAQRYVSDAANIQSLKADDLEEFNKPAGRKKAIAAAMSSILKPGKSIQVSIQDNRWLQSDLSNLPRIKLLRDFLGALLA